MQLPNNSNKIARAQCDRKRKDFGSLGSTKVSFGTERQEQVEVISIGLCSNGGFSSGDLHLFGFYKQEEAGV
jgi:hypothetical protein